MADAADATGAGVAKRGSNATDRLFRIAVILKGIDGGVQLLGGLLLIVVPPAAILALVGAGESPQHSRDPGRYICNNVMFADIAAMTGKGRGGFIHLPYTTSFDAPTKARFAKVVQLAVQAAVDSH